MKYFERFTKEIDRLLNICNGKVIIGDTNEFDYDSITKIKDYEGNMDANESNNGAYLSYSSSVKEWDTNRNAKKSVLIPIPNLSLL